MATIRRKGNKWQAIIRKLDGYPNAYKTWEKKQEAIDWATDEEARRASGLYFPDKLKKLTLTQLIDQYIDHTLPSKPKSFKDILRHLNWWKAELGAYSVIVIDTNMIAKLRKKLLDEPINKNKMRSTATINRYTSALSAVFSYGLKLHSWLRENPCRRLPKFKESPGRTRILGKEECKRLLFACKHSYNHLILPIILIAITTGMRQGEILNLTWDCIDFNQKLISIKMSKNGRPRSVPLTNKVEKYLLQLKEKSQPNIPHLFPSKRRFGHICIRKAWEDVIKRAKIEEIRFHDLRHTFATYAGQAGASNLQLQTAMGHRTLAMLNQYTHMDGMANREVSDSVSETLTGELPWL